MEKLILNDGTVLEDASAVTGETDLFLYIEKTTLGDVFRQLSESRKTEKIVYVQNNGAEIIFLGYTRLTALRDEGDGLITAVLRKEAR